MQNKCLNASSVMSNFSTLLFMPALDPFSASSRPMLPFDSQPSNPLPFAATLQPIDQNAASSSRLPRPKRVHEQPLPYPLPAYSHSRHNSFDLHGLGSAIPYAPIGSDEWMRQRVDACIDTASVDLDIKNLGLKKLSTEIAGLQNLVTLPAPASPRDEPSRRIFTAVPRYAEGPSSSRSFSRISSAPASSAFFTGTHSDRPAGQGRTFGSTANHASGASAAVTPNVKRTMGRSKTNAASMSQAAHVSLYAANNLLRSLPSALFEVTNLTLLSLRGNHLETLPAAIGDLCNLTDLNISNNQIKDLPSTILKLQRLTSLAVYPNPFLRWTFTGDGDTIKTDYYPSGRLLGPRVQHTSQSVPKLYALCIQVLISPRPPSNLPPLLDAFAWDQPSKGQRHPLHDATVLHELIPAISIEDLGMILQALKSSSQSRGRHRDKRRGLASLGVNAKPDPFPLSSRPFPPDDASKNPYYYPCPSPRHLEYEAIMGPRASRHLFVQPAEERIEWKKLLGQEVPIRWKGCSPGCLAFLEADEDEWELSDED